jgi:hypothetical protein
MEFDVYIMIIKSLLSCKDFTKANKYLNVLIRAFCSAGHVPMALPQMHAPSMHLFWVFAG